MTKPASPKHTRPMGSGGISERRTASGAVTYEARISLPVVTGPDGRKRRPQMGATFRTRKEAKEWLTKQLHDKNQGTLTRDHQLTVGAWLERWLEIKAATRRPKTLRSYSDLLRHLPEEVTSLKLRDLRPFHLDEAYARLLAASVAPQESGQPKRRAVGPATVRGLNRVVRSALSDAQRREYVSRNVATLVEPIEVARVERPVWESSQVRAFLEAVAEDRLAPLWTLLLHTGIRRGEALGLRWEDVDLNGAEGFGSARITRQVVSVGGKVVRGEPKTGNGVRVVGLSPQVVTELRAWRKRQMREREDAERAGVPWGNDPEIFTNTVGRVMDPDTVSKRFRLLATRVAKETGQPIVRLHDLRHTVATHLLAAGLDDHAVSRHMGHSSVSVTKALYGHVLEDSSQTVARALAARLSG